MGRDLSGETAFRTYGDMQQLCLTYAQILTSLLTINLNNIHIGNSDADKSIRKLKDHLDQGGMAFTYQVTDRRYTDMIASLIEDYNYDPRNSGLPYDGDIIPYAVNDDGNIILRCPFDRNMNHDEKGASDFKKIAMMEDIVLKARTNFYMETDEASLEDAVARVHEKNPKLGDVLFTIKDLDIYESEALMNKCNNIGKGFTVGVSRYEDENGDITENKTIPAAALYKKNGNDFCRAIFFMNTSLYGANERIKKEQMDYDFEIQRQLSNLEELPEPCEYIVASAEHPDTEYLKISKSGFSYTHNGTTEVISDSYPTGEKNPNYASMLQKCLSQVFDKRSFTSVSSFRKYIEDEEWKNIRPEGDEDCVKKERAQKNVATKLDAIARSRIDMNKDISPESRYMEYLRELEKLVKAIKEKDPSEYDKEKFEEIEEKLSYAGIDISVFDKPLEKMLEKGVTTRNAMKLNREIVKESQENTEKLRGAIKGKEETR